MRSLAQEDSAGEGQRANVASRTICPLSTRWLGGETDCSCGRPASDPTAHSQGPTSSQQSIFSSPAADVCHPIPVSTGRPEQKATAHQRKEVSPKQHPGRMSNSREHQLGTHQQDAWPSSVTFSSLEEKIVREAGWLGMGSG